MKSLLGSDPNVNTTPPKLTFYALPAAGRRPEPSGLATPPIRVPGAVPFRWEEAPGKPRPGSASPGSIGRSLSLPPRLSFMANSFSFGSKDEEKGEDISSTSFGSTNSWRTSSLSSNGSLNWNGVSNGSVEEMQIKETEKESKVTIRRHRKRISISRALSAAYFWTSIYGRLKRSVIPRRRERKV